MLFGAMVFAWKVLEVCRSLGCHKLCRASLLQKYKGSRWGETIMHRTKCARGGGGVVSIVSIVSIVSFVSFVIL